MGKRFPLTARKKSAKGIVGGEPSKARTVPREGVKERSSQLPRNCGTASVGREPLWDEIVVGAAEEDTPVEARRSSLLCLDSICRTAVYVTRSYGGVGGGSREASPYPEWNGRSAPFNARLHPRMMKD